jgi:DNA-binding XRE family transcriptional regulator
MNGLELKELRKKLNLTQVELAKRIGVDTKTVQNWESGRKIPNSKDAILRSLEINAHTFAGGGASVETQTNQSGDNINAGTMTVNHNSQGDETLMKLLVTKEEALRESQKQISDLIIIINRLTQPNQ